MSRPPHPTPESTGQAVRLLLQRGHLDLAPPGNGDTPSRHRTLMEITRRHRVGVGRLVEAHCDAVAILAEADRPPVADALYGVWASASPENGPTADGRSISGIKRFCSGLGLVDRALVTATDHRGGSQLFDLSVRSQSTVRHDTGGWSTIALADTATGDAVFSVHPLDDDAEVGDADWYLRRPGFWQGACGPAACWAGAVTGLVDAARSSKPTDPHRLAHLGAMEATVWAFGSLLDSAGRQIDAQPNDTRAAEHLARSLRHTVERLGADALDRFERAFGPRPFTTDADLSGNGFTRIGEVVDGQGLTLLDESSKPIPVDRLGYSHDG